MVGQYVGGGLIERDVAIEALIAAGMCMVNVDHKNPWTAKQVDKKVRDAVHDGMKKPLDGEEPFRLMEEVERRYAENPQLYKDVEEFLTALDAQADEWADAGHSQTVELPWFTEPQEQIRPKGARATIRGAETGEATGRAGAGRTARATPHRSCNISSANMSAAV